MCNLGDESPRLGVDEEDLYNIMLNKKAYTISKTKLKSIAEINNLKLTDHDKSAIFEAIENLRSSTPATSRKTNVVYLNVAEDRSSYISMHTPGERLAHLEDSYCSEISEVSYMKCGSKERIFVNRLVQSDSPDSESLCGAQGPIRTTTGRRGVKWLIYVTPLLILLGFAVYYIITW